MTEKKKATRRPVRVPVGTRNVLKKYEREGFVARYVNDEGNRVSQFIEAGYTPVLRDVADASAVRLQQPSTWGSSVVRESVGGGVYAILMEIPKEYYEEDQLAKQSFVDQQEESIDPTRKIAEATYGARFKKTRG